MTPILRLTQTTEGDSKYRVEVAFEAAGLARQIATARFDFKLTTQDQEDLRWYLEDFLQYPLDPAPKIAARIENRMVELGTKLFKDIFQSGEDARDLWATLRDRLDDTRVEIISGVREAAAIPWELIRDPKTDTPLSCALVPLCVLTLKLHNVLSYLKRAAGPFESCLSFAARVEATMCLSDL